jgi:hypothetical protein
MGVDQPECGAGRASPAKWSHTNTGKKKPRKGRSSGCRLQVGGAENDLLAIRPQSSNTPFSVAPRESWSRGRGRGVVVVASGKLQEVFL